METKFNKTRGQELAEHGLKQREFNFNVLVPQNNKESEEILLLCEKRLTNNCRIILEALQRGERLSGIDIITKYKITEYRRRIKDLIDAGYDIKYEIGKSGCKTWWME